MVRDMAVQQLTNRLTGSLTGLLGGLLAGSGAAGGSVVSSIIPSAGGINFGSFAPALPGFTPSGVAGARAAGGPVLGGQTYLVGERGPELFQAPSSGGSIVPNHALAAAGGGGGGLHIGNINVTVQSSGGNQEMDRRSGQQVGAAAYAEMQRQHLRDGN